MKLVLASTSPRRIDLLTQAGVYFDTLSAEIDEQLKSVIDVRTKHYLQFEKIRFFLKEDMLSIALNELSELINHCKKYTVEEWDSTFFTQIEQLKDKLLKDNE